MQSSLSKRGGEIASVAMTATTRPPSSDGAVAGSPDMEESAGAGAAGEGRRVPHGMRRE